MQAKGPSVGILDSSLELDVVSMESLKRLYIWRKDLISLLYFSVAQRRSSWMGLSGSLSYSILSKRAFHTSILFCFACSKYSFSNDPIVYLSYISNSKMDSFCRPFITWFIDGFCCCPLSIFLRYHSSPSHDILILFQARFSDFWGLTKRD